MSAQNCCSSLLRGHRNAQNRCSSLLEGHSSAQNRCSSLLESHKSASKVLLKPASRLQWRSKSLVQYHCSKSLFEDAGLCDALPCSPLLLFYLPPCMDMHGFTSSLSINSAWRFGGLGALVRVTPTKHRYLPHLAPLSVRNTAICRTWCF